MLYFQVISMLLVIIIRPVTDETYFKKLLGEPIQTSLNLYFSHLW